jgi:hypothetical protein
MQVVLMHMKDQYTNVSGTKSLPSWTSMGTTRGELAEIVSYLCSSALVFFDSDNSVSTQVQDASRHTSPNDYSKKHHQRRAMVRCTTIGRLKVENSRLCQSRPARPQGRRKRIGRGALAHTIPRLQQGNAYLATVVLF